MRQLPSAINEKKKNQNNNNNKNNRVNMTKFYLQSGFQSKGQNNFCINVIHSHSYFAVLKDRMAINRKTKRLKANDWRYCQQVT